MFKRTDKPSATVTPAGKPARKSESIATQSASKSDPGASQRARKGTARGVPNPPDPGKLPPGQMAYEARRAAKAGVSLDRWMADKRKRTEADLEAQRRAVAKQTPRPPGLLRRLLDRAHKPL